MAVELFKPFIIRKLIERGIVKTVKSAKKIVERKTTEVWDILESIIDGHPIMWAGPVENWIAACDAILDMDVETIVPGHGPMFTSAELRARKLTAVSCRMLDPKRGERGRVSLALRGHPRHLAVPPRV